MGSTILERVILERQRAARRAIADELRRTRLDEGLSLRQVGAAAGFHASHLPRIEAGDRQPSLDALVALASAMGHDLSVRLFPSSGPRVRDHIQVRMVEALLAVLDARWVARLEVPVCRPVRGVIDVLLRDRASGDLVAGEAHSGLHAVERQLRWARQKTDALPSARGWPWSDNPAPDDTGRLLLLRSSAANRELVATLPRTFEAAYPADPAHALAALTDRDTRWPGAAILWVTVDGASTRLMAGVPRELRSR